MTPLPRATKAFLAATAASTLLLTAACGGDSGSGSSETATSSEAPSADSGDAAESGDYADGDFEAEGSYSNPGGTSSVSVALTLEDGTVTDLEVTPGASGTSLQFQNKFISGIDAEVVGKSLDELDVSKVAGSSLTSGGFNSAIDAIKADAQA